MPHPLRLDQPYLTWKTRGLDPCGRFWCEADDMGPFLDGGHNVAKPILTVGIVVEQILAQCRV